MKRRRVLHVIDSLHLGGAQEVILNLIAGSSEDYCHEVATLHGHGIYWDRLKALNVPVHSLSPHKFLPLWLPNLFALLKRRPVDILHCHLLAANLIAKPVGALAGVPVILNHDHTNDPERRTRRALLALDRTANRTADHIIAVSTTCRDFLVQEEKIAPGDVSLVLNAVDVARFDPRSMRRPEAREKLGVPSNAPLIAGAGRLNPQKNFLLFLEIAAAIHREFPEARFLIAGTGPEEAMLKERSRSLGLESAVTFAGYVADPRLVYRACDLLLMPSRYEGLPMTLLEAMAMGTPVVASRLDGMAEVIDSGTDGFLCASEKPESFVEEIRKLLSSPDLAEAIGTAARTKVLEKFSAERMVREVEAIYQRCLP